MTNGAPLTSDWRHRLLGYYLRHARHRGKIRLAKALRRLMLLGDVVYETKEGIRLQLDPSEFVQSYLLWFGEYEPQTMARILDICRDATLVVDVGGHVGLFALTAAKTLDKRGTVVAIEPNPHTFNCLLRNIALNDLRNIKPVLGLAGACWDVIDMTGAPAANWGQSRQASDSDDTAYQAVAFPLAEYLRRLGLGVPDLVKIDVEGHESAVLEGLFADPGMRPRNIILEHLQDHFQDASAALEILRNSGYKLLNVEGNRVDSVRPIPDNNIWAQWVSLN